MVLLTLAQEISPSRSRSRAVSTRTRSRLADSATSDIRLSSTDGNSPPYALGQKYCAWRSAAEWKVRACTPRAPSCCSRPRISPAARVVNVTASTAVGW